MKFQVKFYDIIDHNKCPSSKKSAEKCILRKSYFHHSEPNYIYEGEVQLLQDDLDSFLEIANKLKIGGLYGALAENEGDEKTEEPKFEYDMNCSKDFIEDVIESNQKARTQTKKN